MIDKAIHSPELLLGPTTPAAYNDHISQDLHFTSRHARLTAFDAAVALAVDALAVDALAVVSLDPVALAPVTAASFDTPAVMVTGT